MPSYLTDPGLWSKGGGLFGGKEASRARPGDIPSMADRYGPRLRTRGRRSRRDSAGAKRAQEITAQSIADMLGKSQQSVLTRMLDDSAKRRQQEMAALAGLRLRRSRATPHDLWGQTAAELPERRRRAAVDGRRAGRADGPGAGRGACAAGCARWLARLHGGTDLATPEAGAAQVGSEGGANTGAMMGQVGTAWGGYGATRPEYIGFMTGQNQMQLAREGIEADRDIRLEFGKMALDNPKTAQEMWLAQQENKRQNVSTSIAQQTLRTNIAMQRAKIRQDYLEMMQSAKTDAQKLQATKWAKRQELALDQQSLAIDQQNANSRGLSATASMTSAEASASRAATAKWKAEHPQPTGTAAKYSTGPYQQKIASAMYNAHNLFDDSGHTKAAGRSKYAFDILWPQMAAHIPVGKRAAAKKLLQQRLLNAARAYKAKPSGGGSALYPGGGGGPQG